MAQGYIPVDRPGTLIAITHRVRPEHREALDAVADEHGVDRAVVLRALLALVADGHKHVHRALASKLAGVVEADAETR